MRIAKAWSSMCQGGWHAVGTHPLWGTAGIWEQSIVQRKEISDHGIKNGAPKKKVL